MVERRIADLSRNGATIPTDEEDEHDLPGQRIDYSLQNRDVTTFRYGNARSNLQREDGPECEREQAQDDDQNTKLLQDCGHYDCTELAGSIVNPTECEYQTV